MARPTKLTKALIEQVANLMRAGNYAETAAAFAGIAKSTLFQWLRDGARDSAAGKHTMLAQFSDSVKRAEAQAEASALSRIRLSAEKSWQADAWFLERRFSNRYAMHSKVQAEITGKEGGPIEHRYDFSHLSDEEVQRELETAAVAEAESIARGAVAEGEAG